MRGLKCQLLLTSSTHVRDAYGPEVFRRVLTNFQIHDSVGSPRGASPNLDTKNGQKTPAIRAHDKHGGYLQDRRAPAHRTLRVTFLSATPRGVLLPKNYDNHVG